MTTVKILVVDDEEYIRDLVSSALRIAGFESLVATDGSRALSSVAANDPDLVVLDVGLPGGIDGFEVCRRLRADGDETPVIFLTARDTNEDKVSGFTKGVTTTSPSRSAWRSWWRGSGPCCAAARGRSIPPTA
jgi:two-component system OmpR family response regulator